MTGATLVDEFEGEADDLKTHVKACSLRYRDIKQQLGRLERWFMWLFGLLITGMGAIIMKLWT